MPLADAGHGDKQPEVPQHVSCSFVMQWHARLCQKRPDTTMKTIDEMLNLALLTVDQHHQISAWIANADSPEDILKMPAPLWQAVQRASAVMGIDDDLMRPPAFDAEDIPG